MLYVTTRRKQDAYTAHRAFAQNRDDAGGLFVPMHLPHLEQSQLRTLGTKSFSQNVADMMNLFFTVELDSWAVEFAIGRYPVKLVRLDGRTLIAQTWHNPSWRFGRLVSGLEKAVRQSDQISPTPSDWLAIAARIAVLAGIFGELIGNAEMDVTMPLDIAVPSGDFSAAMAVWYARNMGLPIGNLIICCNENDGVWNLLNKGEFRTGAASKPTATPLCDNVVPVDLERLIDATLGNRETLRFCDACNRGVGYYLEPEQVEKLRQGIHVCVVGQHRMEATLKHLYKDHGYLSDPYTALVCGGVGDYRAQTGAGGVVLALSEDSPQHFAPVLSRCLDIRQNEIRDRIKNS